MIQRVQSLFLFGVGVCMIAMLFVMIWEKQNPETGQLATLDTMYLTIGQMGEGGDMGEIKSQQGVFWIAGLCVLTALIAFTSLFSYKNRLTQMKLNTLNALLIVGTLGSALYMIYFKGEQLFLHETQGNYQIGFYLPAVALILNSIANRFIRKDEMLVRSVDRIR